MSALPRPSSEHVEDILPATPLQSGLVAASMKTHSAYLGQFVYSVPADFAMDRIRQAYQAIVQAHAILRTSFVSTHDGIYQVVGKHTYPMTSQMTMALSEFLQSDMAQGFPWQEYQPPHRLTILNDTDSGSTVLVMTMHHAIYDGWSTPLFVKDMADAYLGTTLVERPPFRRLVNYICAQDPQASNSFWASYLEGIDMGASFSLGPVWDPLDTSTHCEMILNTMSMADVQGACRSHGITAATFFRAAWALTMHKYTRSTNVLFGEVLSGRDIPLADVDR